ncbi:MAG: DUF480 domain-containing protein [Phycisphaerae bacterium]|nr:DUF480 domain-containing protein [Phycisphaerae bacterium]
MVTLTPDESRVLGVLIEKSLTTPNQYPLSLNAIVDGSNQKNNRDPVLQMSEDAAFAAAEGLREKQLAVRIDQVGGRVHKYRHNAIETLHVRTAEVVILAELLMRGPQTLGELRGRASRMHPLESIERVKDMIRALTDRPEPYVQQIPPSPGSRAERYVQLLCPNLHEIPMTEAIDSPPSGSPATSSIQARVERLETEVQELRASISKLAMAVGEESLARDNPSDHP